MTSGASPMLDGRLPRLFSCLVMWFVCAGGFGWIDWTLAPLLDLVRRTVLAPLLVARLCRFLPPPLLACLVYIALLFLVFWLAWVPMLVSPLRSFPRWQLKS